MKNKAMAMAILLLTTGCVTHPAEYSFEKTRTYNQSKNKTWEKLMEYFTDNGVPIKNIEKDSGIIYAENIYGGQDTNLYADCGQHGLTQLTSSKFEMNVFVKSVGASKSKATANLKVTGAKQFGGHPPIIVQCSSKGIIEERILEALK